MSPRIGLQLFSVRDELERDPEQTLRTVAALGYEGVELFGGLPASAVHGLEVIGRHITLDADVDALDCDRVTLAWVDPFSTVPERDVLIEQITALGERVRATGRAFGFHNHWSEVPPLEDGVSLLERLPEWVDLELDLGWAWFAGADPGALLERYRGRTPLVHVKDLRNRTTPEFCAVGEGGVGYADLLPQAAALGVEWLIVEQDEGADAAALERSYEMVTA
jgi:sugar phosphate isomerase/epimerase